VKDRWIDAVRERPKLLQRRRRVPFGCVESGLEVFAIDQLTREPEPDLERNQPLLSAVVEILLNAPSLSLGGLDDPRARRAQLLDQVCVLKQHQRGRGQPLDDAGIEGWIVNQRCCWAVAPCDPGDTVGPRVARTAARQRVTTNAAVFGPTRLPEVSSALTASR
jgi:hypothetical protein